MDFNRQSAQVSLAFLIAATITLGMVILTGVLLGQSFHGMEQARVTAARTTVHQLVISVNDRINSITQPPATALAVLRHGPLTKAQTLPDRLERLPVIADVLDSSEIVSAVYAGYDDGDFFLLRKITGDSSRRFPDVPEGSRYLLQSLVWKKGQPVGLWRFYDRQLRLLENRPLPDYNYDPRQRPWYQAANKIGGMQLSSPYVFFSTGETGLTLSWRAKNQPGTVLGIDVTMDDLDDQLADLNQTPGSRLAIINRQGDVLASSLAKESDNTILFRVLDKRDSGAVVQLESNGKDWYGFSAPLDALPNQQLYAVIGIPSDELLADVWSVLARQTLVAGLIALVLLVFGWFVSRQVGKPLEQLAERVSRLSRFRFDTRIRTDSRIREASRLSIALDDMAHTIESFQNIATALNRGQDLHQLLRDILSQLIRIVGQERGAIYLFSQHESQLKLAVAQELDCPTTITTVSAGMDDNGLIRELRRHVDGHPVFAVLRNRSRKLIGVLLIEMEKGEQTGLSNDLIVFVDKIAGSAAVAIQTRELIESQQALLEGIIHLVANAIDAKSPYTGGHCERVPRLAQMLTDEAEKSREGLFRNFRMTEDERYEFHLAAWLHDCGKITTPEYVVDKAVKLETIHNRIHEIRTRFEVLHRDADIRYLTACLAGENEHLAADERQRRHRELQEQFAFLAKHNEGSERMPDDAAERIRQIGAQSWLRHFSDRLGLSEDERQAIAGQTEPSLPTPEPLLADRPEHRREWGNQKPPVQRDNPANRWGFDMEPPAHAYNRGELHNLTIRYGTLTPEERFRIQEHIVQTICMLDALPLPDHLTNVPRLAGTHHERMDGQGYPRRLPGEEMSIPERIMAVADVFEALTAVDRPYKRGKTLSEALGLMHDMVRRGHIDRSVFELFVRSGTYRRYAEQHLRPEQIDTVDESLFMQP